LTGYSTAHEIERGMRDRTGGSGRAMIMSSSISWWFSNIWCGRTRRSNGGGLLQDS